MKVLQNLWVTVSVIFTMKTCCTFGRYSEVFPADYNKFEPPVYLGNPTHLYIDLEILDIDRIDESRMEFSMQTYIYEYWRDWRLNVSNYMYGVGQAFPQTFVPDLWTPDLVFDNAKSGVLFGLAVPNTHVEVANDGLTLIRGSRYNLVIGCKMNFLYYPMDTQSCFFELSLFACPDHRVTLHWADEEGNPKRMPEAITFANEIQALKYKIEQPKAHKKHLYFAVGNNYTYLYANFTFVRLLSGSLLNTYVPSTLIVCFSWLSFWLEVSAVPARVTLGATSLLTLVTQMVQARQGLPPISYMTAMDIWLFACLLTVFGSLLAFAIAYHIDVMQKKNASAVQEVNHRMFKPDVTGPYSDLRQRISPSVKKSIQIRANVFKTQKSCRKKNTEISLDRYFRIAFPVTFTIFAVLYWTFYLSCT